MRQGVGGPSKTRSRWWNCRLTCRESVIDQTFGELCVEEPQTSGGRVVSCDWSLLRIDWSLLKKDEKFGPQQEDLWVSSAAAHNVLSNPSLTATQVWQILPPSACKSLPSDLIFYCTAKKSQPPLSGVQSKLIVLIELKLLLVWSVMPWNPHFLTEHILNRADEHSYMNSSHWIVGKKTSLLTASESPLTHRMYSGHFLPRQEKETFNRMLSAYTVTKKKKKVTALRLIREFSEC